MTEPVGVSVRLDIDRLSPQFMKAMAALDSAATTELDQEGIDPQLRELVRLRASQMNGCAYCVSLHTTDARTTGVVETQLSALPVWRESPWFTERERAALELTEAITRLSETRVPQPVWDCAAREFNKPELAALVALIVTINAWNGIGASTHAWSPLR